MTNIKIVTIPFTNEQINNLRAGDSVLITGEIYTGRDAAHIRFDNLISSGKELPIDLTDQIIYYVGPTPAKEGKLIGSAGPTTSSRMDKYTPNLLSLGLKGMIGKGLRSQSVIDSMKENKAVYFVAVGGAAALIASCIEEVEVVAYEDLGTEAVHRMKVKNFPAIVAIDSEGNNLFQEGKAEYKK